jgi:hypothetical protein
MGRKRIIASVVVVLLGAAFLVGYVPQQRRRASAEMEIGSLQNRLVAAEDRVRTSELLGRILTVQEVTARQDYGHAQDLSSAFFDAVRAEASATHNAQLRDGLNEALAKRDAVTAALAKADPTAIEALHSIELRLRQALGYPVPPEPAPR